MAPLPLREMVAVSIAQLCEAYQATVLFPFIVFMVESFDEGKNPRTVGALLAVRWPDSYSLRVPGVPCHLACLVFVPPYAQAFMSVHWQPRSSPGSSLRARFGYIVGGVRVPVVVPPPVVCASTACVDCTLAKAGVTRVSAWRRGLGPGCHLPPSLRSSLVCTASLSTCRPFPLSDIVITAVFCVTGRDFRPIWSQTLHHDQLCWLGSRLARVWYELLSQLLLFL